jgi:hypothetical protein
VRKKQRHSPAIVGFAMNALKHHRSNCYAHGATIGEFMEIIPSYHHGTTFANLKRDDNVALYHLEVLIGD